MSKFAPGPPWHSRAVLVLLWLACRAHSGAGQPPAMRGGEGCVILLGGPGVWACPSSLHYPSPGTVPSTPGWCCRRPGHARCLFPHNMPLLHQDRGKHGAGHQRERVGRIRMCWLGWQSQECAGWQGTATSDEGMTPVDLLPQVRGTRSAGPDYRAPSTQAQ